MIQLKKTIDFKLPKELACPLPTELRGLARDQSRLLLTAAGGKQIEHVAFWQLDQYLNEGDVLVVNTSQTMPAAIDIDLAHGKKGVLHLSNKISDKQWLVEIRERIDNKTVRWKEGLAAMSFALPQGGKLILQERFYSNRQLLDLWQAEIHTHESLTDYIYAHGRPIKYENLDKQYPLDYYQTFFSFHPGSSEMPSAARGFTPDLINRLIQKGIRIAPILLHTGVSSLEENERPYPEYMEISPITASMINQAKLSGKRVIAVGTTAVRAIESAASVNGKIIPFKGNTELFIDEYYQMKAADGLLTGFHEPKASHLFMLQSIAGIDHIQKAYEVALEHGYYWHVFGDLHLILP